MHINDSSLTLGASHRLREEGSRQILQGPLPTSFDALLDDAMRSADPGDPGSAALVLPLPAAREPGLAATLQRMIEMLFGPGAVKAGSGEVPDVAGPPGLRRLPQFELVHTRVEESCSFSASGKVCLADGSTREFDVGYEMARSEESTRLALGSGLRDPLVLDFGAPAARLGTQRADFDLDADGQAESLRLPDAGSAFLFHDLNRNGRADDGSELFGPRSGNGFAELARLDDDGNQWIDAGDAAYADLMLWRVGADGAADYQTLADAGIGALSTRHAETPFTLKEDGAVVGQVRSSGVWLGETGGAGIVRQIDIATAPAAETPPAAA